MATDEKSAAPSGDAIVTTTKTKTNEPAGAPKLTDPPKADTPKAIELKTATEDAAPLAAEPLVPASLIPQARISRYTPLAASLAIAIGVLGGALGSAALLWSTAPTE